MLRLYTLEPNSPTAAKTARATKGASSMATKALSPYNRHVKAFAKSHPGMKGPALMKAASKTWRGKSSSPAKRAKKAAKAATRAITKTRRKASHRAPAKRVVGYDPKKVRVVPVKRGARAGRKRAISIGRGIYKVVRNPGAIIDRVKKALSVNTVGSIVGVGAGGAAAVLFPMLLASYDSGGTGVALSGLATALAAAGAAIVFPAAVIPIVIGGGLLTALRAFITFVPTGLSSILQPLFTWAGAPPAPAPAPGQPAQQAPAAQIAQAAQAAVAAVAATNPSGTAAGWDTRRAGRAAGFRGEQGRLPARAESFNNAEIDY
jgi:hypothetical protein